MPMTIDGENELEVPSKTALTTIVGGMPSTSGSEDNRCTAHLKQGSVGWNMERISQPGERCHRKVIRDGLCWTHLTYGGMR